MGSSPRLVMSSWDPPTSIPSSKQGLVRNFPGKFRKELSMESFDQRHGKWKISPPENFFSGKRKILRKFPMEIRFFAGFPTKIVKSAPATRRTPRTRSGSCHVAQRAPRAHGGLGQKGGLLENFQEYSSSSSRQHRLEMATSSRGDKGKAPMVEQEDIGTEEGELLDVHPPLPEPTGRSGSNRKRKRHAREEEGPLAGAVLPATEEEKRAENARKKAEKDENFRQNSIFRHRWFVWFTQETNNQTPLEKRFFYFWILTRNSEFPVAFDGACDCEVFGGERETGCSTLGNICFSDVSTFGEIFGGSSEKLE
ncbi:hypothetical protein R1sor_025065 [Riccia sorocarpa]|uniref:Uncharacterized protein n=1 Tax=Riccia sorocarpa TaxID=122646 RepID=A0ABD3G921_9MARC